MYLEGNAVRKIQEMPSRHEVPAGAKTAQKNQAIKKEQRRQRELSEAARRNREKALSMGRNFVIFMAVVCVAILFVCVNYIQLLSEKTTAMKNVANLESEWTSLKEENDAYESQLNTNVDLNSIKEKAMGSLGMDYPTGDQTQTYSVPDSSYVRQYQDLPDSD